MKSDESAIEVERQLLELARFPYLQQMLDALPIYAMIVNNHGQILAMGQLLKEQEGDGFDQTLGLRLGDLLRCVRRKSGPGFCGLGDFCGCCRLSEALERCVREQQRQFADVTFVSEQGEFDANRDLAVTIVPLDLSSREWFGLVSVEDVSDHRRRIALERVFFHDLLNTAAGLEGWVNYLKECSDPNEQSEVISDLEQAAQSLVFEIEAYRSLALAEKGELVVNLQEISTETVLLEAAQLAKMLNAAKNKILLVQECVPCTFQTDPTLAKRVVLNATKNALEASESGDTVTTGCDVSEHQVTFWVHNRQVMPQEIQSQIFERSFSTKGEGRGLGTYGMKIITTQHLKGSVVFSSVNGAGTLFKITLPRQGAERQGVERQSEAEQQGEAKPA